MQKAVAVEFPWGTASVNMIGCFIVGLLYAMIDRRLVIGPEARSALFIGFLGAFTTFSSYMLETVNMLRDGQITWALGNIMLQNTAGCALVLVGLIIGRAM